MNLQDANSNSYWVGVSVIRAHLWQKAILLQLLHFYHATACNVMHGIAVAILSVRQTRVL